MNNTTVSTPLTEHTGIRVPLICGPMYPCSNPELVAAASDAGGIGIIQPVSLTFVHGYDFREGIKKIRSLTDKPVGMNALIEKSSQKYHDRMDQWISIALEEGVRFFVTSLGNPRWVVDKVKAYGGVVYHDATERKWALKAIDGGVDGLIAVNNRAGGHAGAKSPQQLLDELGDLGVPVVCAGGIGSEQQFAAAIDSGYAGCQLGTRFIATTECNVALPYKQAIIDANESDIVLSERITGVPVSIIKTPYIDKVGIKPGPIARWLLKSKRTRHWMRMFYTTRSVFQLKKSSQDISGKLDFWMAGKSVSGIEAIEPVATIIHRYEKALNANNINQ